MSDTIDRSSAIPIYVQLADLIRKRIESGEWAPEQKIPSENEFNALFGISRMTVRQVLARLVDEGLLFRVQGKGTFVAQSKFRTRSPSYRGIREQLEQQGYATTTEVLATEIAEADRRVGQSLGVAEGTPVSVIRRLRRVEGKPISLHESYVPVVLAPDVVEKDLVGQQLCTILDFDYGLQMARVTETLETTTSTKSQAALLGHRTGAPLLLLEQTISARSGTPFEFSRIAFRGDLIKLEFHYKL
ncbi:GntR family transcriptional regulator [Streptomyces shenzhenensis]|uniref:GntR family transcriptional regulator n=1 Tax=Streptomyces shenzhenensis TaxID=943815 RepID=UPI0033DBF9D3